MGSSCSGSLISGQVSSSSWCTSYAVPNFLAHKYLPKTQWQQTLIHFPSNLLLVSTNICDLLPLSSSSLSLSLLLLLIYNVCKMFLLLLMVKIFGLFTVIFYTHTLTHIFPFLPAGCLRISISIEFVWLIDLALTFPLLPFISFTVPSEFLLFVYFQCYSQWPSVIYCTINWFINTSN